MNRNSHQAEQTVVDDHDLLCFDSWEYDGTSIVEATSTFDSSSGQSSLPSMQSSSMATTASTSMSGNSRSSNGSGSSSSASSSSSIPKTCTVSKSYKPNYPTKLQIALNATTIHDESMVATNEDIVVCVSGTTFRVPIKIFEQLRPLPWQQGCPCCTSPNTAYRHPHSRSNYYYLPTSPTLFEILLHYSLFTSLPNTKNLSKTDIEELEPMTLICGFHGLTQHLQKNPKNVVAKNRTTKKTFLKKTARGDNKTECLRRLLVPGRKLSSNYSDNDNSKTGPTTVNTGGKALSKWIQEASRKLNTTLNNSNASSDNNNSTQARKTTHEECVASCDLVL